MNKIFSLLLVAVIASSSYADSSIEERFSSLENRIKVLEKLILEDKITESPEFKKKISKNEKSEYMKKIKISSLKAKFMDSLLDGKVPGLTFKLKNEGDKTLSMVEVTVYFMDKDGTVIYEEDYHPVNTAGMFSDSKPLKPNYSWRMERGKFYQAKSVPDDWKAGKVKAEITDIEFSKEQ